MHTALLAGTSAPRSVDEEMRGKTKSKKCQNDTWPPQARSKLGADTPETAMCGVRQDRRQTPRRASPTS